MVNYPRDRLKKLINTSGTFIVTDLFNKLKIQLKELGFREEEYELVTHNEIDDTRDLQL